MSKQFSWLFFFHIVNYKDKDIKNVYLYKLNKVFEDSLTDSKTVIIISNASIKNNIAISILHVCLGYNILAKTIYHAINITSTEVEFFAIRCGINQIIQVIDITHIIVITNAIHSVRWIFDLLSHSY